MKLTSQQIANLVGGQLVGSGARWAECATNDHRTITAAGALFCCFSGAKADGHDYLPLAAQSGATVALVQATRLDSVRSMAQQLDLVAVEDVQAALWRLATACREAYKGPAVATTGSAGKTTTKNMLRAILTGQWGEGLSTVGNHNNLLGVPLTLVGLSDAHAFLNLELGSNAPGEIPQLAKLARPSVAVITAVLEAHLQGFGSLDGVLAEKASLGVAVGEKGVVVIPSYDARLAGFRFPGTRVTFGYKPDDDVCIVGERETAEGCQATMLVQGKAHEVRLPVAGVFNLRNAAAAVAASVHLGVPALDAVGHLSQFRPEPMRMERVEWHGATFLLDAYNANPGSMEVALRSLASRSTAGKRIALLGAMFELGEQSSALHARIGSLAASLGLTLVVIGSGAEAYLAASGTGGVHVQDATGAAAWIRENVREGDTLLLKGSRSAKVETVLHALRDEVA